MGTVNWFPILPRDASLSDSLCKVLQGKAIANWLLRGSFGQSNGAVINDEERLLNTGNGVVTALFAWCIKLFVLMTMVY